MIKCHEMLIGARVASTIGTWDTRNPIKARSVEVYAHKITVISHTVIDTRNAAEIVSMMLKEKKGPSKIATNDDIVVIQKRGRYDKDDKLTLTVTAMGHHDCRELHTLVFEVETGLTADQFDALLTK